MEIQVRAAGLNFMDVLKTLALYPGVPEGPLALGGECAGTVIAVGEGVTDLAPGDDVLALAQPAFASFVTLPACHVMKKPAALSFEDAATIPVAFSTAYYALHHLGRIQPGESILIHSAAGGVGLAALQLAQRAGATVYATAGCEEKRAYLRSLGVEHVLDSRTLDFAEEIRRLTGGRGVDLVLHFLAGEAMAKSVETLAPHGRFLEIGRTVIYQNQPLELYPFRQNLSYFAIDMNLVCRDRAPLLREMLQELVALFEDGSLRPLPFAPYALADAGDAFRHMARRKHVGKLVLTLDPRPAAARPAGTQHAGGTLSIALPDTPVPAVDVPAILDRCPRRLPAAELYARFREVGIDYGPYFQAVDWIQANDREVLARVHLPGAAREDHGYVLHPALLDGALQALAGLFFHQAATPDHVYVPFAIDRVRMVRDLPQAIYSHGVRVDRSTTAQAERDVVRADVKVLDEQGRLVLALDGVCLKQIPRIGSHKPIADDAPAVGREVPCPPDAADRIPQLLTHPGTGEDFVKAAPAPLEPPDWFYEIRWRPAPSPTGIPRPPATWLILMDRLGVGEALLERLETAGDHCIPVHPGPSFVDREAFGFTLPLADPTAHHALVDHLLARGITPTGVVHLATLTTATEPAASPEALQKTLEEGVYPLLYLTQALATRCKTPLDFRLIATSGQAIPGIDPPVLPEQAALWGLGRVIAREYPRIDCSGLDLETAGRTTTELAAELAAELAHTPAEVGAERWIALRRGQRLAGELVPLDATSLPQEPLPLRDDGVYLITGGQGGIGLALAEYLATRVRCRLVLLNRTPLDPDLQPERAAAVRALEALGAEVLPAAGDVADPDAMRALLAEIDRRWGRLDGIVHAAGLLRDGLIMNTDGQRLAEVLRPKVFGAQVLDDLTRDRTLDFFVLCSSVSALLAPPGQGNYVAANAYLDAFAHWRTRARGQWTASVNWGPWADTGLAAAPRYREIMQDLGMGCMPTPAAVAAFDQLLRLRRSQLAFVHLLQEPPSTAPSPNLQFDICSFGCPLGVAILETAAGAPAEPLTTHHSPLTFNRAAVVEALQDRMVTQIARALQLPPARISREDSLLDLGLDSLMAVEVMGALKSQLDLPLSPTVLFDYPTIASLTEHLVDEYGPELQERLGTFEESLALQSA